MEGKMNDVVKTFRSLDFSIRQIQKGGEEGTLRRIKEVAGRMTGQVINTNEVATVCAIAGSLFKLSWRDDVQTSDGNGDYDDLCISINDRDTYDEKLFSNSFFEKRVEMMRQRLETWHEENLGKPTDIAVFNIKCPPCRSTKFKRKNECSNIVKGGFNAEMVLTREESEKLESGGLDALRELAINRGRKQQKLELEADALKQKTTDLARYRSLVLICDALRSLSRLEAKSTMMLSMIFTQLSQDFRSSRAETARRIKLLASLIPEYITIISPDETIDEPTLRLNKHVVYAKVREKLGEIVKDRLKAETSSH